MLLSIAKIRCRIKIATYTNKAKTCIVKLKMSKSLSIHIVIQLSRHILLSKSEFIKENIDEIILMFALFKCRKFDKRRN